MTKDKKKVEEQQIIANDLEEAVKKVQELSAQNKRKFNESVDLAVKLGIDPKQSDQNVKGSILLPNGSGKQVKVVVFTADEEQGKLAVEAGAVESGLEDLIKKVEGGYLDFDCCIATPDVMQKISKIARKLGPRGLMPSPKNGTVTKDVQKAVTEALKGKANFKNDKAGIIHCLVGKVDFDAKALVENAQAIIKVIKDSKPESAKGKFIKRFYLNTTMGRSVEIAAENL